jgi:nucleotide sugar dehydrogenase
MNKRLQVCVIGLGKMGLPLATILASKGCEVIGVDTNKQLVDTINKNIFPIDEPGIKTLFHKNMHRIVATLDTITAVKISDVIIVLVPLLVDKEMKEDYTALDNVTNNISLGLGKGKLVIYETTVPVGTTRERFVPVLESSGLKAGNDFYVSFSPERVMTGKIGEYFHTIPKVVGGINQQSLKKATSFYKKVSEAGVHQVSSLEAAELAKLMDMVYRDVTIALANEFSRYCDDNRLSFEEVRQACNSNPLAHMLKAGIGVGGHCTPVYPYFVINKALQSGKRMYLAEAARQINDGMSTYSIGMLWKALGSTLEGKQILLLGLAFRPGVKEDACSTTYLLKEKLEREGAKVYVQDPLYSKEELLSKGLTPYDNTLLTVLDAVVLVTEHKEYSKLNFKDFGVKLVVDGRNYLNRTRLNKQGIKVVSIGA